jgi:hypothetical protein
MYENAKFNERYPAPIIFEDDFTKTVLSTTADAGVWFYTENSGTVVMTDSAIGGKATLTTAATTDNAQCSMQVNGEAFKLDRKVEFRAIGVQVDDASVAGMLVGLGITDTDPFGNDTANAISDFIGFLWDGTDLFAVSVKNASVAAWPTATTGNKVDTGLALADATDVELAFVYEKGLAIFYVDGVEATRISDYATTKTLIPDDQTLTPTVAVQELSSGARALLIDYVRVEMARS